MYTERRENDVKSEATQQTGFKTYWAEQLDNKFTEWGTAKAERTTWQKNRNTKLSRLHSSDTEVQAYTHCVAVRA